MKSACLVLFLMLVYWPAYAEDIVRESFEGPVRTSPLVHIWGDVPSTVATNATEPGAGRDGSSAARLRLTFPAQVAENLSYWSYVLPQPVPLMPELKSISSVS